MRHKILQCLAVFAAFVLLLALYNLRTGRIEEEEPDIASYRDYMYEKKVAAFHAQKLDGEAFEWEELGEKRLNIVYFWATWSEPSQYHLKELGKYKKDIPEDIRIFTVCLDARYEKSLARNILNKADFEGMTLVGGTDYLNDVIAETQYVPMTLFLDGEGKQIRKPVIGISDDYEDILDEEVYEYD